MKHWKLAGSTAALALFAGNAAFADVTPEEVWQNWQDASATFGQTIAAESATRDGDTLVVSGVKMTMAQDGFSFDAALDEIRFTDNGDGTVGITMSDSYPMSMTMPAPEGVADAPDTQLDITISQPGMAITAGGSATETSYDFTAPTVSVAIAATSSDSADNVANIGVGLTGMTGKYLVAGADATKSLDSTFTAQNMTLTVAGTDAATDTVFNMTASVADMAGASKGTFLGMEAMADMAAALKSGFASNGNFTYGATSFTVDVTEAGSPSKVAGTMTGGDFTFGIDTAGLVYGSSTKGMDLTLSGADIPFPELKLTFGDAAFNLMMPLMKSDAPSGFALLLRVVDLGVSEELWGMFDPTAALPHDPATVIIDTKGQVTLTHDLVDPVQMEALGDAPPGEINALDLTELRVSIAGAELTGTGAFTFDNTDMTTFAGVPAPTGKIDLKLIGANTLVDKLVGMGLLTEDMANQGRMMASMFANPGAGEDELTSTLEFKDKGFYANGMQLQ